MGKIDDIYPRTPMRALNKATVGHKDQDRYDIDTVAALCGMSVGFVRRTLDIGRPDSSIGIASVLDLLESDAFAETFVPRSLIPDYLAAQKAKPSFGILALSNPHVLMLGSALDLIPQLPADSINCVVTSTPYWATRLYEQHEPVIWADGETCAFGHEQTPEGFLRHTTQLLWLLKPSLKQDASVWWNLMDTYNTRTQIRGNAAETLRAMQGHDSRGWKDYACRRYSAGHSYLEDGEQCLIPTRVAERASRIGYWVKSVITWKKTGSMPETVASRVTREVEYILHLSVHRTPFFAKGAIQTMPVELGGRNKKFESEKITDIWTLSTASGTDGHGAQFPVALPARCIALSTRPGDRILDPFIGSGSTSIASAKLGRQSVGFDVSAAYLNTAQSRLTECLSAIQTEMILVDGVIG
jgi:DNA modification methylase